MAVTVVVMRIGCMRAMVRVGTVAVMPVAMRVMGQVTEAFLAVEGKEQQAEAVETGDQDASKPTI